MSERAEKVAQEIHERIARECCAMKRRLASLGSAADQTPSPLAYRVDYDSLSHRSEFMGYSIAGRHPTQIPETPAPNAYNSPSYLGDGVPKWSVANKVIVIDDPLPGPCEYSPEPLLVRRAAPSFTMRHKTGPPLFFSKESPPGCNAYNPKPEVSHVAASLKGRQREFKSLKTPGPANYLIPSSLPSGPQFSMVSRGEYDAEDDPAFWDGKVPHQPPGPASYSPKANVMLSKSPSYSLGMRSKVPGPAVDASPGPAYAPMLGTMERNEGPRVALKGRRHERIDPLPGPADYTVGQTPTVDDLVKVLHHRKLAAAAAQRQLRASLKPSATDPIPPIPKSKSTPGPADYNTAKSSRVKYRSAPSFSLRTRAQLVTGGPVGTDQGPAPNAYAPPPNRNNRGVSFKGRLGEGVLVFPSLRLDTLRVNV
ncbi:hypothetical protein BCR44DRAFT_60251 [Catenaria anguillulae PL171]|uniref:Uncharacterized protein n=1 Tax=Catenaria anguillulae PL171 TaxID=765915 RepID=A0A1Y2HKN4_9FUNG|nr:hypothetical protein BCR44DRAFT_60251 [Catenaria anguillulae PL171]